LLLYILTRHLKIQKWNEANERRYQIADLSISLKEGLLPSLSIKFMVYVFYN
jgi:hypothetical protein